MRVQFPTEEELRDRIERHLAARRGAPEVVIAWSGYLAALTESLFDYAGQSWAR